MNDSDKVCTQTPEGQERINRIAKAEACAEQGMGTEGHYNLGAKLEAVRSYRDDRTAELKLSIFHTILQTRLAMGPIEAAEAAEAVFQKLCIPQPPSVFIPHATPMPG